MKIYEPAELSLDDVFAFFQRTDVFVQGAVLKFVVIPQKGIYQSRLHTFFDDAVSICEQIIDQWVGESRLKVIKKPGVFHNIDSLTKNSKNSPNALR